jgi:hypothetical protein
MAFDPTAPGDTFGMVALNAVTQVTVNLDPRYQYKLIHTGADASGNDDASSALSAWLSTRSAVITANKATEDEKFELLDGTSETFGPGISTLYLVSTANADAVLKIVRVGTSVNSY